MFKITNLETNQDIRFNHLYYLDKQFRTQCHFFAFESKKARKKRSDKNVLDVDTPSLSFKLTRSGINPSHKHSLWPRALFPCYDSVREGFQPIQVWSDLSHFPRLVQAIDSTQRRRPLLASPPSNLPAPLLTSLAISLHHLLNADGVSRWLLEVKRERDKLFYL